MGLFITILFNRDDFTNVSCIGCLPLVFISIILGIVAFGHRVMLFIVRFILITIIMAVIFVLLIVKHLPNIPDISFVFKCIVVVASGAITILWDRHDQAKLAKSKRKKKTYLS